MSFQGQEDYEFQVRLDHRVNFTLPIQGLKWWSLNSHLILTGYIPYQLETCSQLLRDCEGNPADGPCCQFPSFGCKDKTKQDREKSKRQSSDGARPILTAVILIAHAAC